MATRVCPEIRRVGHVRGERARVRDRRVGSPPPSLGNRRVCHSEGHERGWLGPLAARCRGPVARAVRHTNRPDTERGERLGCGRGARPSSGADRYARGERLPRDRAYASGGRQRQPPGRCGRPRVMVPESDAASAYSDGADYGLSGGPVRGGEWRAAVSRQGLADGDRRDRRDCCRATVGCGGWSCSGCVRSACSLPAGRLRSGFPAFGRSGGRVGLVRTPCGRMDPGGTPNSSRGTLGASRAHLHRSSCHNAADRLDLRRSVRGSAARQPARRAACLRRSSPRARGSGYRGCLALLLGPSSGGGVRGWRGGGGRRGRSRTPALRFDPVLVGWGDGGRRVSRCRRAALGVVARAARHRGTGRSSSRGARVPGCGRGSASAIGDVPGRSGRWTGRQHTHTGRRGCGLGRHGT